MRRKVDLAKLEQFMEQLGRSASTPGVVYFTGGVTSLWLGIREQTVDIDLKLDPEPGGAFEAIARLKNELEVNVELASPEDFVPALPGWRDRSPLYRKVAKIEFRHYDIYSQALAKIERGHELDWEDVREYVRRGLVEQQRLKGLFEEVRKELLRYPAIDAIELARKVSLFAAESKDGQSDVR